MSVETITDRPVLAYRSELGLFVPEEQANFIGSLLCRRELREAWSAGEALAEDAHNYLTGDNDQVHDFSFYVGKIAAPRTRAVHLLHHAAFVQNLYYNDAVRYDPVHESYVASHANHQVIDLATRSVTNARALFRVEDHHELDNSSGAKGEAGCVRYVTPEVKLQADLNEIERRSRAEQAAMRLIAES